MGLQHLQGVQPSKDQLGRMLDQIQTIERHVKYLSCLHFIEECRLVWREGEGMKIRTFQR